ncbi:hypothetical protein GCM10010109_75500 [Actinoplanes campanulatus]|nr:hypothetical protein GCM10010109_75500 [Actinoplanes campanulatus]GID42328.1 hypothetical protein Aca09nite_88340 [Actinoplanes campanulatus]
MTEMLLVGDSTVTDEDGWGGGFRARLTSGIRCVNHARGGRSSRSYRSEGHWDAALAAVRGGFVLIQFGHNDQSGKGPERESDAETEFPAHLAGTSPRRGRTASPRFSSPRRPGGIRSTRSGPGPRPPGGSRWRSRFRFLICTPAAAP